MLRGQDQGEDQGKSQNDNNDNNNINQNNNQNQDENHLSFNDDPFSHYYQRKLYADIMPDISGLSNTKDGVCRNGWRNSDCNTFHYDSGFSLSFSSTHTFVKYLSLVFFSFFIALYV